MIDVSGRVHSSCPCQDEEEIPVPDSEFMAALHAAVGSDYQV